MLPKSGKNKAYFALLGFLTLYRHTPNITTDEHTRKLKVSGGLLKKPPCSGIYSLDEKLPGHSSLTRLRRRWGAEMFKKIFVKTVESCIDAGLVNGETVHVDATLHRR